MIPFALAVSLNTWKEESLSGFGNISQFHSKSDIRLIDSISTHRLIISQDRKGKFQGDAQNLFKDMGHQSFHRSLDILDRDKRHLHIDLGELRLTIRAKVFIPKAPYDLKVSVKPGDHQDLLKKLGRLRQRVKMARAEPAGNQKVSCSLRGAFGKHRGFDFQKP